MEVQEGKLCQKTRKLLYRNHKQEISDQITLNLGYIKSEKFMEPSGEHFSLPGHILSDIEGMVIEQVRRHNPYILRARKRETLLIQNFYSYSYGLNKGS